MIASALLWIASILQGVSADCSEIQCLYCLYLFVYVVVMFVDFDFVMSCFIHFPLSFVLTSYGTA